MADFTRDEWDDKHPGGCEDEDRIGFPGDGKTTCAHCGKVIEVGQRAYLATLGSAHVECDDDWEPTDDPEYWTPDGERAYQGNEHEIRWRIVTPYGQPIDVDGNDEPLMTRRDAIVFAGSPHLGMAQYHFERLLRETETVAGWVSIQVGDWRIEPIIREKKTDA